MGRRKMKPNNFKVAHNTQDWWGFTLQRGHVFGLYKPDPDKRGVCYVSGGEPDSKHKNCLIAYQQTAQKQTPDCYQWNPVSVHVNSVLGRYILDALRSSPYDAVSIPVDYQRIQREWQPMPENYAVKEPVQDKNGMYIVGNARVYRKPAATVQHMQGKPRPNFPTFQSKRPEYTPRPPKTKTMSYMADSHTTEEYKAITAASETADLWAKNAAAMHKAKWIEKFLAESKGKKDAAAAENIYSRLYL